MNENKLSKYFLVAFSMIAGTVANASEIKIFSAPVDKYSIIELSSGNSISHIDFETKYAEVDVQRSSKLGKMVFKPKSKNDFTVFLTDDSGVTHVVKISPEENIDPKLIIVPSSSDIKKDYNSSLQERLNLKKVNYSLSLNESRNKTILSLIKAIAESKLPNNVTAEEVNKPYSMWQETTVTHTKNFTTGTLVAMEFLLKNNTQSSLKISEKEFYLFEKNVAAVAIEKPEIESGQTTKVFIVKHK